MEYNPQKKTHRSFLGHRNAEDEQLTAVQALAAQLPISGETDPAIANLIERVNGGDLTAAQELMVLYQGTSQENLGGPKGITQNGLDPGEGGGKKGCKRWESIGKEYKDQGQITLTTKQDLADGYSREHSQHAEADEQKGTTLAVLRRRASIDGELDRGTARRDPGAGDASALQTTEAIPPSRIYNLGEPAPKAAVDLPPPPQSVAGPPRSSGASSSTRSSRRRYPEPAWTAAPAAVDASSSGGLQPQAPPQSDHVVIDMSAYMDDYDAAGAAELLGGEESSGPCVVQ